MYFFPVANAVADDEDDNGDANVLKSEASYTHRQYVHPRTVRLQRWKCFAAKKLTLYLDPSAQRVSYMTYNYVIFKY